MEYYDRNWVFRFGEMLMPTVANGITLDWDLARARGENWELELHRGLFPAKNHRASPVELREPRQHGQLSRSHRRLSLGPGLRSRTSPSIASRAA